MAKYADNGNGVGPMGRVTTEYATAGIVIGCLVALIFIRRGFRGINLPGVGGVSVK